MAEKLGIKRCANPKGCNVGIPPDEEYCPTCKQLLIIEGEIKRKPRGLEKWMGDEK